MITPKPALIVLSVVLLSLSASASDWYVDAVNGNDTNNGQSGGSAWKTLTHALSSIPSTPLVAHTIHVAPGVYDPANGELYPLTMRPHIRIVGDQGRAATFLESARSTLLLFNSSQATTGYFFDTDSGADGLTLRNSISGIGATTNWNPVNASFHDLVIVGMSTDAVYVEAGTNFGGPHAHPTFDHVTIAGCQRGMSVYGYGACSSCFGNAAADLVDCVVRDNVSDGIRVDGSHGGASVDLVRVRIIGNGGSGIGGSTGNAAGTVVTANASLIAGNGGWGLGISGSGMTSSSFTLTDCTVASNASAGLRVQDNFPHTESALLENCIFFGNGDDVVAAGTISARYCDSGDGDLNAYSHCFAADPLFVNTAIGDYRLRFGSPCVDVGDPASNGQLDLLSHARPLDGDLDTVSAVDIGAFELETLHRIGTPTLGQQFGFEFWGAQGSFSMLLLSKQPLTAPQSAPFGDSYLAPGTVITLATVPAKPGPPYVLRRTMPNNPALIGTTFSFQALTDSVLAPQGQAYTNPTSFVVMP